MRSEGNSGDGFVPPLMKVDVVDVALQAEQQELFLGHGFLCGRPKGHRLGVSGSIVHQHQYLLVAPAGLWEGPQNF